MKLENIEEELTYYNGLNNLRGIKTKVKPLTKLQKVKTALCKQNVEYFAEEYYYIVSQDNGRHKIKLRDYQKTMIKMLLNEDRVVMNTSRQIGKTVVTAIPILHYALFNEAKLIGIAGDNLATAKEILDRIKSAYMELPIWLQKPVVKWNEKEVRFADGTRILAQATTGSTFRGLSMNWVFVDETAFVDDLLWAAFTDAFLATVADSVTAKITYTSTPNGYNHFHRIWTDAVNGVSNFKPFQVVWTDVKTRNEAWKIKTMKDIDAIDKESAFRQNYCGEFITTGTTFIKQGIIEKLSYLTALNADDGKDYLNIYENPLKNHIYSIGVDLGKGVGKDFTTIQIVDITDVDNIKLVLSFRHNNIGSIEIAPIIEFFSVYYNNAYTLVENNKFDVADDLFYNYGFDNLVHNKDNGVAGIYTDKKTKPIMLNNLKYLITNNKLHIPDYHTINELAHFVVKNNGSIEDTIMGLALALYVLKLGVVDNDQESITREVKQKAIVSFLL